MIKTVTLKIDTELFRAFLKETGGGEDFTGIAGLASYDEQVTKDNWGIPYDNGIEIVSVDVEA